MAHHCVHSLTLAPWAFIILWNGTRANCSDPESICHSTRDAARPPLTWSISVLVPSLVLPFLLQFLLQTQALLSPKSQLWQAPAPPRPSRGQAVQMMSLLIISHCSCYSAMSLPQNGCVCYLLLATIVALHWDGCWPRTVFFQTTVAAAKNINSSLSVCR